MASFFIAVLAGAAAVGALSAADAPGGVKAILEVDRDAYYAGDPVPVRLSIWNDGSASAEAPGGAIEPGFDLRDADGNKIPIAGLSEAPAGQPAAKALQAGAFFGFARDFTTLYPKLKQAGTYRLQWTSAALSSNAVILRVVPRYDPEKNYLARVETDAGPFTIEFLRKDAPIAVKTFIELASTGFYDGQIFHYVEPGRIVMAGDPTGTGLGGPGFAIPIEKP